MEPNKKIIETDEIDLGEVIRKLWKEKFLILSISLIFSVLAYATIVLKPKQFQTTIVLKNIPSTLFIKFEDYIKLQQQQQEQQQQQQQQQPTTFASLFEKEFHEKLYSFENLDRFVKQNNKINSFKTFLKENEISAKDYFLNGTSKDKFGQEKDKNKIIKNRYYLNFPKELKGDEFLNEYVLYVFQDAQKNIRNKILSLILIEKSKYEKSLSIANELNIQDPILQQKLEDRSLFMINEPKELFYSGVTVIQKEIDSLNKLITEAKELKLDFELYSLIYWYVACLLIGHYSAHNIKLTKKHKYIKSNNDTFVALPVVGLVNLLTYGIPILILDHFLNFL